MKAIQTRYLPPTNTRTARIKAWAEGVKPLVVPYAYGLGTDLAHIDAAMRLCARMEWTYSLVSGGLPNGDHCHCLVPNT